jgi:hypothetical protein
MIIFLKCILTFFFKSVKSVTSSQQKDLRFLRFLRFLRRREGQITYAPCLTCHFNVSKIINS